LAQLEASDSAELSQAIHQYSPLPRVDRPAATYSCLNKHKLDQWVANKLAPIPFSRQSEVAMCQRIAQIEIVELWALSRVWGDNTEPVCSVIQSLLDVHLWPRLQHERDNAQILLDARNAGWITAENDFSDPGLAVALATDYLGRLFHYPADAGQVFVLWTLNHINELSTPQERMFASVLGWWPKAIEILRQWVTETIGRYDEDTPLAERYKILVRLATCDRLLREAGKPIDGGFGDAPSVVWAYLARLPKFIVNVLEMIGETDPNIYARHFDRASSNSVRSSLACSIRRMYQNGQSVQLKDKDMALAIRCDLSSTSKSELNELKRNVKALRRWLDLPNSNLTREQIAILVELIGPQESRRLPKDLVERARWKLSLPYDLKIVWEMLGDLRDEWIDRLGHHELKRLNIARLVQHLKAQTTVSKTALRLIERVT
jgi:hypothetical protein